MYKAMALLVGILGLQGVALAADPCDGFAWDVRVERALFARDAQPSIAGMDAEHAPTLVTATGYSLALGPQGQVRFVAGPGKQSLPDGAHAGVVKVRLAHAGLYRVSLDVPAWIDAVAAGQLVPSRAFQGRAGCSAPHKVVEYDLPAGDVWIQISGSMADHARVTVTETPVK